MLSRRAFLRASALLPGLAVGTRAGALEAGRPSRTAHAAALERAAHQILESPRVFEDPLALRILGAAEVSRMAHDLDRHRSFRSRAMRAFLAVRSRFAEDELAAAVARGVRQVVVLGAGLDTFGYRNPHRGVQVFEVDHPATQGWKRERLREQWIAVPPGLRFAPVDFERQTLAAGLARAGFRADRPAFFSWLGVTIYLSKPAVSQTLRAVAACPRGSQVVFDFALPEEAISVAERRSRASHAAAVAAAGEAWVNFYAEEALRAELSEAGFSSASSMDADGLNARYFRNRADGFRVYGSGRMMSARV